MKSTTYGSLDDQEETRRCTNESDEVAETTPLFIETPIPKEFNIQNERRSVWSRLVFKWFTPILYRGNEKNMLDESDLELIPLPYDCSTEYATKLFERYWKQELQTNNPSLVRAIFRAFGTDYILAGLLKLVHDPCLFVGPQVLRGMIIFLRQSTGTSIWNGLGLTAAVTCSQIAMSLCLRHYFFKCYTAGLRIRTAVVAAVYQKALILSAEERRNRTLGEITNLMSIDAQRLQDITTYLHVIWSSPLQIALALYFLWRELGVSSLGGVAVILFTIPITKRVSQWMSAMQKVLMNCKDRRLELNSEVLAAMKVIKLQAWEESFQKRILELREMEMIQLFRYYTGSALSGTLWVFTPLAVAVATFSVYVWLGNQLDVATALTSLALFDILRFPLTMLPRIINSIAEAFVSVKRVRSFLLCSEHHPVGPGKMRHNGIEMINVTGSYGTNRPTPKDYDADPKIRELAEKDWEISILQAQLDEAENEIRKLVGRNQLSANEIQLPLATTVQSPLCIKRITFSCEPGEFIAIVGGVGCGKSSLINAILGDVIQVSGTTSVKGKLAYFSQTPFIMNASVRDNILFGHVGETIDESLYQRCLDCCALRHDLTLLPFGDETEIGEKGITLSGGQKARVALARAVYHRGDITLIDDALSAVDAHVAKHLFEQALIVELLRPVGSGYSGARSVVLVTNSIQHLKHPRVNKIIVVQEGRIIDVGTYSFLASNPSSGFARLVSAINDSNNNNNRNASEVSSSVEVDPANVEGQHYVESDTVSKLPQKPSKLMTEETREHGHVGFDVYMTWARAAGGIIVPVMVAIVYVVVESMAVLTNWWLTYWSAHGDSGKSQTYFLGIYAAISVATALAGLCRMVLIYWIGLRASRKLFSEMLETVMFASQAFFDTTPVGRLVNRFSKDIFTTDERLTETIRTYLSTIFTVVSTVVVIAGVTPFFTLCLIPMIAFYMTEQAFFTLTYRELKRLDSVTRSPIYALLGESVDGAAVVRAFSAQDNLFLRLTAMLSKQQHAYFLTCAAQSWLAVRLELIGTLIVTFACLSALAQHLTSGANASFAGLAGLAISYSLSVTQALNWSVRMASDLEANMVAVERIREYTTIENEGKRETQADQELPPVWPTDGEIVFKGVKLRYRPELPLVLKGLDLRIPAGSKVGVVGRTGAGKSTLMIALMRIVEISEGTILIDGVNTRTIGLAKLRRNLAVIPQDPVLFSGTIRMNLDPFNDLSDESLYQALEKVGLWKSKSSTVPNGALNSIASARVDSLENVVLEGGVNFSTGQRQLIVIARALLHDAKIVILDEATAAIDAETDATIQKVFRSEFASATCITVAHRLNTIMDSDLILVMDDGKVAEFDTPTKLFRKGGMFQDLVTAASH